MPLRTLAIGLFLAVTIAALFIARYVVLTAVVGVGLGVLYIPAVEWLHRRFRLPRGVGGLILMLGILLVLGGIGLGLGWLVADQVARLQQSAPRIYEQFQDQIDQLAKRIPGMSQQIRQLDPQSLMASVGKWALGGLQIGVAAIAGLVIVLALSIFTAVSSRRYFDGAVRAFPRDHRDEAGRVMRASARSLRAWAKAQLLDMAAVSVATALGLWIIGVDYWIVLGLISGLLDVIPYVGPVTAALVSTAITLGSEPDKVPWVLGLYVLIQQLEGNVLIPVIMREEADLPEVPLLILIMLMSVWFGLLGALLAAPLLAVGRTVYLMTYLPRMDRRSRRAESAQDAA